MKSFTKSYLEKLKPGEKPYSVSDEGYRGFKGSLNAKVYPTGRVAIFVVYRIKGPDGKLKQLKINVTENVALYFQGAGRGGGNATVDDLRMEAHEIVVGSQRAKKTAAEIEVDAATAMAIEEAGRLAEQAKHKGIAEVGQEYLAYRAGSDPYRGGEHRQVELAVERAAQMWQDKPLTELTVLDAERLMIHVLKIAGPQAANKARGYLPSVLAYGKITIPEIDDTIFRQLRRRNKTLRKQLQAEPRQTVLTQWERPAFFEALKRYEAGELGGYKNTSQKADCIRLIYLCAARKSEWLKAVWGHVDLDARTWERPDENRKNGSHVMTLPSAAVPILKRIQERLQDEGKSVAKDAPIFPGVGPTALRDALQAVKAAAGIESDLCIHDLRRSRVTQWAIEEERSEFAIAAAIGSSDIKTLIRHYMVDAVDEEQKRARVEAQDDAELI